MALIGIRAHDYPGDTPEKLFSAIGADGFQAVQLAIPKSFGAPYPTPGPLLNRIGQALSENGLQVAVLGCYIQPALADEAARLAQVDTFINAMPAARFLHAHCIGTETPPFSGPEADRAAAFARVVDSVRRMADAAEKFDVRIGIEPVATHVVATPELAAELLEKVGSERMGIIWDPVNLLTEALLPDQPAFYQRCWQAFGKRVVAVHVKDCVYDGRGGREGVALFTGQADWDALFALLRQSPQLPLIRDEGIHALGRQEQQLIREKMMD